VNVTISVSAGGALAYSERIDMELRAIDTRALRRAAGATQLRREVERGLGGPAYR
jgi:hypothetical protein